MSAVPPPVLGLIRLREGFRAVVYGDTMTPPNLTAGVGHKLSPSEANAMPRGTPVSAEQIEVWFDEDTELAYHSAAGQQYVIIPDASIADALVNALTPVNFQLGGGWYRKFPRTWALLKAHHWNEAAAEVAHSAWYRETHVRVEDFQQALRSLTVQPDMAPPSTAQPNAA